MSASLTRMTPPFFSWLYPRRPSARRRRTVRTLHLRIEATSRRSWYCGPPLSAVVGAVGDCVVFTSLPSGGAGVGGEEFGLVCVQGGSEGLVVARSHAGAGAALQLPEVVRGDADEVGELLDFHPRLHALGADSRPVHCVSGWGLCHA